MKQTSYITLFNWEERATVLLADPAAGGGSLAALRMSVAPAAAAGNLHTCAGMERARSRSRWLLRLWRLTQLPVLALQLLATVAPAVVLIGLLPRDSEGELCCDAMPASIGAGSDSQ